MNFRKNKAFGLLEVLLAGVIIIIVLSALMVVARSAIDNSVLLQQRAQATYLAQEGIELVRQIRDSNYVDGSAFTKWNTLIGLNFKEEIEYGKEFVISETTLPQRICAGEPVANNPNMDGVINIDGTEFSRKVVFLPAVGSLNDPQLKYDSDAVSDQSFKVKVTVSWKSKLANKQIEIETLLTNSRQGY